MMKHSRWVFVAIFMLLVAAVAEARPRSGASFSGRSGFRSSSGFRSNSYSNTNRSYSTNRPGFGGGSSFVFLPSFGWGMGGFGGGGGMGLLGTLLIVGVVGVGAVAVVRAIKRNANRHANPELWEDGDHAQLEAPEQSYIYKIQLGVGRSGRSIQARLLDFATQGDTGSQEGLAELLRQTALELVREKDSIRYALAENSGPFSLAKGESRLGAMAMQERSHFQVERVRGADGAVRKSTGPATVGADVLEYIVVTLLIATRRPIKEISPVADRSELEQVLSALGGVPSNILLGLEVIWLPADEEDTLTETDVMTTFPELRSL